jgi:hypothetical protein
MGVKAKRNYFDAIDFDEIGDSLDLFIHNIQTAFDFDALDGKDTFNAIVLSPPVPIGATGEEMDAFLGKTNGGSSDTLPKFTFHARLSEGDSSHVFWPDVCDPKFIEEGGTQQEALDWIGKHLKVLAIDATQKPNVGDTVRVKLNKQGIFTASPEHAIMDGVVTSLDGLSEEARAQLESKECQDALNKLFENYDGSTNGSVATSPTAATYKGTAGDLYVENGLLEESGVVLESPPEDLFTTDAGGRTPLFIPEALESFNKLAKAYKDYFKEPISIRTSYRNFATQEKMKADYGSGAATPGTSNHGWGVAFDVNRTLIVDGKELDKNDPATKDRRFDSEVYKWLDANGPSFGWINPPGLRRGKPNAEAWHWENVVIRDRHFQGRKPVPEYAIVDGEEEPPN